MNIPSESFEEAIQHAVQPGPERLLPGVALAAASIREGERHIHSFTLHKRISPTTPTKVGGYQRLTIQHRFTYRLSDGYDEIADTAMLAILHVGVIH